MKVLIVNCVFKQGSTGKIVDDIRYCLLSSKIECVVCFGRGEESRESNVIKVSKEWYSMLNGLRARITGLLYGGAHWSTRNLEKIILSEKPDIVHVHCINGNFVNIYRFISFLKENRIKTLLTLHAEFIHTANCGHAFDCEKWKTGCGKCPRYRLDGSWFFDRTAKSWKLMKDAFEGFNNRIIVSSVSPWLMNRAMNSPILKGKPHYVVLNGLDIGIFHYYPVNDVRINLGLKASETLIFHATPVFDNNPHNIKGGCYIIQLAELMPEVTFVVAGRYDKTIKVPANIILLGNVKDQSLLAKYYSAADVCVLTSKKETFSMVCAESLSCGTPIVGYLAGAPEMISLKDYSCFVKYGDVNALKNAIYQTLDKQFDKRIISLEAQRVYSKQTMTEEYIKLYNKLLQSD